jgi:hypothetical protein
MQKRRLRYSLAALSLSLPFLAAAQSNPVFSTIGSTVTITGCPFQGKRVGRFVQKLADGTTATQVVRGQMARDSEGRVRVEEQDAEQPVSVEVLDPMTHSSLRWSSASTSATLMSIPRELHVTFPSQPALAARESSIEEREPAKITKEDLGKKTINGLLTTGTRSTMTVSNGKIVHDVWFSEDLKIAVLETFTEPQGSQHTIEIQEVIRGEPDPALFRLPQGYIANRKSIFDGGIRHNQ